MDKKQTQVVHSHLTFLGHGKDHSALGTVDGARIRGTQKKTVNSLITARMQSDPTPHFINLLLRK